MSGLWWKSTAAFLQVKCLAAADHIGARHSKPESRAITLSSHVLLALVQFHLAEGDWNFLAPSV